MQAAPTPIQQRTQVGSSTQRRNRLNIDAFDESSRASTLRVQQTPSQRQPLAKIGANALNRSGISGYGMSAGVKVGRQQG